LYTGTRAGAIESASPYAEAGRSYVDLERGIFYRKPIGKRATKKRQTPAPIPPRLLAHLRRWEAAGFLGMSPEVLQQTYGHHHPDYLHGAAAAIG
jgi:hypothetical protein